jgi:K+-transporting ATPase c subunit
MKNTLKFLFLLALPLVAIYALALSGVARIFFETAYTGDLILEDGVCRGSYRIDQPFDGVAFVSVKPTLSQSDAYILLEEALQQAHKLWSFDGQDEPAILKQLQPFIEKKSLGFLGPVRLNKIRANIWLKNLTNHDENNNF